MKLVPSTYRSLFGVPGVARLVAGALVGRLPVGIVSLALVLFVHAQFGGFAVAGATAAAYALAQGGVAPLLGRLVDLAGQGRMLVIAGTVNAGALAGVVVAAGAGAAILVIVGLAALSGAARPPLSACVRRLLATMLGPGAELDSAYALESVLVEVIYVSGPLLTAGLAAAGSPGTALLTAAALAWGGTLWFAASPPARAWRPEPSTVGRAGALASPGMRTVIAGALLVGVAFGAFEVALPAFAARHGSAAAGGLGLAAMALASLVAGLWYGARRFSGPLVTRYLWLAVLFSAALVPPVFAPSTAVIVVLMAFAGLFLAPLGTCTYTLIDRLAPAGTLTEAFTWLTAANVAGSAAGNGLAGLASQSGGVRSALALAALAGAAATLVSLARRQTLEGSSAAPGLPGAPDPGGYTRRPARL